jgi:hypothetical protein
MIVVAVAVVLITLVFYVVSLAFTEMLDAFASAVPEMCCTSNKSIMRLIDKLRVSVREHKYVDIPYRL